MSPTDNPTVWCERCKKYHKYYTFTEEDRKKWIVASAKRLADAIDEAALKKIYGDK
jgi:acetyl-CoA acetyltransferase